MKRLLYAWVLSYLLVTVLLGIAIVYDNARRTTEVKLKNYEQVKNTDNTDLNWIL